MNLKALRCYIGFFAYYAHWIPKFVKKVKSLTVSPTFPYGEKAVKALEDPKMDNAKSVATAIDETIQFAVKTDDSEAVIVATLNQLGWAVAFFSSLIKES